MAEKDTSRERERERENGVERDSATANFFLQWSSVMRRGKPSCLPPFIGEDKSKWTSPFVYQPLHHHE